jgi:uncharacterized protein YjbI with pentapeptide repeats
MISLRRRVLGIATTAAVTAGTVVLWSGVASGVTCPVVARGTGTVTPGPAPGVNWSGCDLAGADLSGANLSGANLSRANLGVANLTGSNLSGADLGDSDIDGAILTDTDLNGTVMQGIDSVLGVRSGGITGTPASLPGVVWQPTYLIDGYLAGSDVDLNGADLASADLAGIDFESASFEGADLANANLTGASVDGDLEGANLSGTDLADAYMAGVSSGGITGTPARLPQDWLLKMGYLIGFDAQVTQANLTGVNLAGADMQMINLTGTNLTDANLAGANLANAGFGLTTLTDANLSGADLAGVTSWSVTGTPTALPQHWTLRNGYLFGPKAWFYAADFSGQNLSGLDLAAAFLQNCNLTGANLSGTNFTDADLAGAGIANADIAQTVLAGASLDYIGSGGGITGTPASLPAGWALRSGWLIGPYVTLDHENLTGVNLSGMDMAGAEISWTTFTGANLSGTDLAGAFFMPADFTKADLAGADLFGADLQDVTWTDATCPDGSSASSHGGDCASALAFRFAGFITPKPGSTVAASARRLTVSFKLATTSGAVIRASIAAAIGAAKEVRATLAGPGIRATTVYCAWNSSIKKLACTIPDPHGIKKGKSHSYTITVAEEPGTSFQTAPRLGRAANPETIHFG